MNQYLNRVRDEDEQQYLGIHQRHQTGDVDVQTHSVGLGKVEPT